VLAGERVVVEEEGEPRPLTIGARVRGDKSGNRRQQVAVGCASNKKWQYIMRQGNVEASGGGMWWNKQAGEECDRRSLRNQTESGGAWLRARIRWRERAH